MVFFLILMDTEFTTSVYKHTYICTWGLGVYTKNVPRPPSPHSLDDVGISMFIAVEEKVEDDKEEVWIAANQQCAQKQP